MLIRGVQQATSASLARKGTRKMLKRVLTIIGLTMTLVVFAGLALKYGSRNAQANIGEVNLAQASILGLITAVFFRERQPVTITRVTPPYKEEDRIRDQQSAPEPKTSGESPARSEGSSNAAKARNVPAYPPPDDESAATGIGRSVRNDVQWIKMD